MPTRPQERAAYTAPKGSPSKPEGASRTLQIAKQPAPLWRVGRIGTMAILGLFVVSLTLAALHAVLVENQAALDNLLEQNRLRREQIDSLQARVAHLDSPEGLAEQAFSAGLVPAADVVTLTPVGAGLLPPPSDDPFRLAGLEPEVGDRGEVVG